MKFHPPQQYRPHFAPPGMRRTRRFLLRRLLGFLFFLVIPMMALGFAARVFFFERPEMVPERTPIGFLAFCGLPLVVVLIIGALGTLIFRSVGTPLANIMAATDAVAEGDLGTRLPEDGSGEFRRMARSFNHMAEELERADQQRRSLTADVAHELRTPLHILRGNLEGLLDGVYQATPDQIEAMLDETRLLTRLVDDLQTLSLAEAGQLRFKHEPVDLAELIADASTSFSGPLEAAGIELQVKLKGQPQDQIFEGDAERLDQVLGNLLGNALRHTPAGGQIWLNATANPQEIKIQVRDSGEGIAETDLPYIFDRFWRGDKSRSRSSGSGSGLGLAIARQFVQAHGGTIQVESQPGQGTTFTITIPKSIRQS